MRVIIDKRYESYIENWIIKKLVKKNIYKSMEFYNYRICFKGHWKVDIQNDDRFKLTYKKNSISAYIHENKVPKDEFIQVYLQNICAVFENAGTKLEKETSEVKKINSFEANEFTFHIKKKERYKLCIITTEEFYIVFNVNCIFEEDILHETDDIIKSLTTFEDVKKYKKSFEDLNSEEYVSTTVYGLPTKKKNLAGLLQALIFFGVAIPIIMFLINTELRKSFQIKDLQVFMFNNEGIWLAVDFVCSILLAYCILDIITKKIVTPLSIKKLNKKLEAEGKVKISRNKNISAQVFILVISLILVLFSYTTYSYVSAEGVYKSGFWQLTPHKIISYENVKEFTDTLQYNVSQQKYMMHIVIIDKNNVKIRFDEILFDTGKQESERNFVMDKLEDVNEVKTLVRQKSPNAIINFNIDKSFRDNEKIIKEKLLDNDAEVNKYFSELLFNK